MIPHYIDKDRVLDLAYEDEALSVLMGRTSQHRDRGTKLSSRLVYIHYRLIYIDGNVWREELPRGRWRDDDEGACPPIDGKAWEAYNVQRELLEDRPQWTCELAYMSVERSELKRWLTALKKLVGKGLGEEALVAVDIQPEHVDLWSLGEESAFVRLACAEGSPARDGLGCCVVFGATLREIVREASTGALELRRYGPRLIVDGQPVWCAAVPATELPRLGTDVFSCGGVFARALEFASTDEARQHYRSLQVELLGGGRVCVSAANGHVLFSETVEVEGLTLPECFESIVEVPAKVVRAVLKAGRGACLLSFDIARLRIIVSNNQLRVSVPWSKPAVHLRSVFEPKGDTETFTLSREDADALAAKAHGATSSLCFGERFEIVALADARRKLAPTYLAQALDALERPVQVTVQPGPLDPVIFSCQGRRVFVAPCR